MKKLLLLLLTPLFVFCGNRNNADDSLLAEVRFTSPEHIRSQVGAVIQLGVEVPRNFNGTFSWAIDNLPFSTEQNPVLQFERYGTGRITVTVTSASGQSRTLAAGYFSAKNKEFQVGMYLPSWRPYRPQPWHQMTHLYLCFGTINRDGSVDIEMIRNTLLPAITDAHKHGVKVLLSIGGGDADVPGEYGFTEAKRHEHTRNIMIRNLVAIVKELNLCGIDVDYEHWDYTPPGLDNPVRAANLEILIRDLRAALPEDRMLTAAISMFMLNNNFFREEVHRYLDKVNLMIYDYRGPWRPQDVGPHSHWEFFVDFIAAARRAGIPDHKIIPGVPFYGVRFFNSPSGAPRAEHITYADIIRRYPNAAHVNRWQSDFGIIYYDGMPMIRQKTEFIVSERLGGIMAWEITQDTDIPEKSLLNVIDDVLSQESRAKSQDSQCLNIRR